MATHSSPTFLRLGPVLLLALCAVSEARDRTPRVRPWRIRSVDFSGNCTFSRRILLDRMVSTPSRFINRVPFSQKVLEDDVRVLNSFYHNQGFLQASVKVHHTMFDSTRKRVSIVLLVEEHQRTYVGNITCTGPSAIGAAQLLGVARTARGKPLLSTVVEDDGGRMVSRYGKRGFLQATVRPSVALRDSGDTADVAFDVAEDGVSYAGDITISGLDKVRTRLVQRELRFSTGDTLTTTAIRASIDGLYRTGLFTRASIIPLLRDSTTGRQVPDPEKTVSVVLSEHDMFDIGTGIGFATDDQLRGSFDVAYRNLFSLGKRIGLRGEASFRTQRTEIVYTDPRFLSLPARLDMGGHYGHYDEEAYEAIIGGVNAALTFPTTYHVEYRARLRAEDVTYLSAQTGEAKPTQSVMGRVTYDTRNDPFAPSAGAYVSLQGEFAGLGGARSNQFLRGILNLRIHHAWRTRTVVSAAAKVGYEHEVLGSAEVPVHERFYAGGNSSIRGFRTRMVGPLDHSTDEPKPLGGRLLIELHPLELRAQVYKALHATLFFDCGNVFERHTEVGLRQLRYAVGGGLSLRTAIGVVRAEAGFPLDRRVSEPWVWPHIDIGYAF